MHDCTKAHFCMCIGFLNEIAPSDFNQNVPSMIFYLNLTTNFTIFRLFCLLFVAWMFCTQKDVKQERRHSELIHGLEHFDKEQGLKHAETSEKVILPNAEGSPQFCTFHSQKPLIYNCHFNKSLLMNKVNKYFELNRCCCWKNSTSDLEGCRRVWCY